MDYVHPDTWQPSTPTTPLVTSLCDPSRDDLVSDVSDVGSDMDAMPDTGNIGSAQYINLLNTTAAHVLSYDVSLGSFDAQMRDILNIILGPASVGIDVLPQPFVTPSPLTVEPCEHDASIMTVEYPLHSTSLLDESARTTDQHDRATPIATPQRGRRNRRLPSTTAASVAASSTANNRTAPRARSPRSPRPVDPVFPPRLNTNVPMHTAFVVIIGREGRYRWPSPSATTLRDYIANFIATGEHESLCIACKGTGRWCRYCCNVMAKRIFLAERYHRIPELCNEYELPTQWIPHITKLARRLAKNERARQYQKDYRFIQANTSASPADAVADN
jgi:hypothetical protein